MGPIYWAVKIALLELCTYCVFFAQSLDCFLFLPTQEAAEKKEAGSNSTETEGADGENKDDAWAKLGDTISSFFGG